MRAIFTVVTFITLLNVSQIIQAEDSPLALVGATLRVKAPITIDANRGDAYFQSGQRVQEVAVDQYYPNCNIELYSLSKSSRKLEADTFTINRVTEFEVYPFTGETTQPMATSFNISSSSQPDVVKLTCEHWESEINGAAEFLTLGQIKKALGSNFSFR